MPQLLLRERLPAARGTIVSIIVKLIKVGVVRAKALGPPLCGFMCFLCVNA